MEEIIALNTEIAEQLPEWVAQLEKIYQRANNWLTFSSICGWIAFGFAIIGLVWVVIHNLNKGE